MARFLVAFLLIAHGLAHASAGIWMSMLLGIKQRAERMIST